MTRPVQVSYLILPYRIHSFVLSIFSISLKPLFLTSVHNHCRLWELGIESAVAFILLGSWDHTFLAVGELPFPYCVVL